MCIVCIANNINRNVYMYLNTRIFPTTDYARVLLFMFIRRELGGTGTEYLFQFTYCETNSSHSFMRLVTHKPKISREITAMTLARMRKQICVFVLLTQVQ